MRGILAGLTLSLVLAILYARGGEGDPSLLQARRGFKTKLIRTERDEEPLVPPPAELFSLVRYRTPAGSMKAYLGKAPTPGKKYPAMIWITGGFPPGGIDSSAWESVSSENDQSAKVYREMGIVMMYPTLRGSFGNPGAQETFYGEVDDVLAALKYLQAMDSVDPGRIYLGGHSTGGTLALLVSEATGGFRAVFSFGPVGDPATYGRENLTYNPDDVKERKLCAPIHFLDGIRSPTYVIEGTRGGNLDSVRKIQGSSTNRNLFVLPVRGASHFNVLWPVNRLIARKIAALEGKAKLELSQQELQKEFDEFRTASREASDLETLAALRRRGIDLGSSQMVRHYLLSWERKNLGAMAKEGKGRGFSASAVVQRKDSDGDTYFLLIIGKRLKLNDLKAVFAISREIQELSDRHSVDYDGWSVK